MVYFILVWPIVWLNNETWAFRCSFLIHFSSSFSWLLDRLISRATWNTSDSILHLMKVKKGTEYSYFWWINLSRKINELQSYYADCINKQPFSLFSVDCTRPKTWTKLIRCYIFQMPFNDHQSYLSKSD